MWVSVDQRAAKLQAVKVEGMKKNFTTRLQSNQPGPSPGSSPGRFYHPQSLTDHNFAAL